jgi:hypothetical protein
MDATKIRLSPSELELACNAEIILTKNTVLAKTKQLLEHVQNEMLSFIQNQNLLKHQLFKISPKISKGENYLGLPYLVLDYPRNFQQQDVFAIRCMFWWGRFFSCTLQLSGTYKNEYLPNIQKLYPELKTEGFYIGIGEDAWQHHFEKENYIAIKDLSEAAYRTILEEQAHIKIAAKYPVEQWHLAANKLFDCWKFFLNELIS